MEDYQRDIRVEAKIKEEAMIKLNILILVIDTINIKSNMLLRIALENLMKNLELRIKELENKNQVLRLRIDTLKKNLRKMINKQNGIKTKT